MIWLRVSQIMQLTRQADYAARAVLFLAGSKMASTAEIAGAQAIPQEYLFKIIQALARAGIVATRRGAWGGVSLARLPEEISLLDVIEAVEGPVAINRCFIEGTDCARESFCSIQDELMAAQLLMSRKLAATDFASLARRELDKKNLPTAGSV